MNFSKNYPLIHLPLHFEQQNYHQQQDQQDHQQQQQQQQQQRSHNNPPLSQHWENVSRIDTVIHELASGQKALCEMQALLDIPMAVLDKHIAWFGMQGFHCLRYYGHRPKEIFNFIATEFGGVRRTSAPLFSHKTARKLVVHTHKIMAELAEGRVTSDVARRHHGSGARSFDFAAVNRDMALYCVCVIEVNQKFRIGRSTLHQIMANAQAGDAAQAGFPRARHLGNLGGNQKGSS